MAEAASSAPDAPAPTELISSHFSTWIQIGAALHSHICAATAVTAHRFAEQEVKMIIVFACSEANAQLLTEREVIKDALNTCLRPQSFMRLENYKVRALASAPTVVHLRRLQAAAAVHLAGSGALRRRADCIRDAFKPAVKRLRDGCDVARRVEESMVASSVLSRAAIMEEQSNLVQVQRQLPLVRAAASSRFFVVDGAAARAHALGNDHSALPDW